MLIGCVLIGDIDVHKTEEIKVQSKPGMWWIIGGRREDKDRRDVDSDTISVSSTTSSVNKDLPPVPLVDAGRPMPKRSNTWDFAPLKNFGMPKRSSTMSTVDTIASLQSSQSSQSTLVPLSEKPLPVIASPAPGALAPAGAPGQGAHTSRPRRYRG